MDSYKGKPHSAKELKSGPSIYNTCGAAMALPGLEMLGRKGISLITYYSLQSKIFYFTTRIWDFVYSLRDTFSKITSI